MLSLAAGGIVAASIATAWLPAVRDSGQRQEADEGRQLSVVARMSSTLLQSVLPAYSQSPTPEALSAALGGARMPMEQLLDEARSTAQIRELLLVTPTWDLVASSPAAGTGTEKLEPLTDHAQLGALLAAGFIFPAVELQAAFHENGFSLLGVFADDFGLTPPEGDVHKGGFLAFFAAFGGEGAADGQSDFGHGCSLRGVLDLGIPGDVPDEHDFVEIGHWGGVKRWLRLFSWVRADNSA